MPKEQSKAVTTAQDNSYSGRFSRMITKEFASAAGDKIVFDEEKRRLAQHLFIKIDGALKEASAKGTPVTWDKVNMQKLSLDAVYRIELGLDALIENHISVIPYFNKALGKYDLDLRIGYSGKDYYRRKFAIDPPKRIIYHLVHENDKLTYQPQDSENPVERYTFEVPKPLDRGKVIGGFGYMVYDDETKNRFIPVSMAEILRAEKVSKSDKFWGPYQDRMQFKTVVNIVTHGRNLPTDPAKVSESYFKVERQEQIADGEIQEDPEVIDIKAEEVKQVEQTKQPEQEPQENKHEPEQTDINQAEIDSMGPPTDDDQPEFMQD